MKITKTLSLPEMIPVRARSQRSRSEDLFSSTVDKPIVRYECTWFDEKKVDGYLPNLVVPANGDLETLFADVATYYSPFSPITAYAHVIDPHMFPGQILPDNESTLRSLQENTRTEQRNGIGVALAIAESLTSAYAAGGNENNVSFPVCRRTLAFSLARTSFIYPELDTQLLTPKWLHLRELTGMEADASISATISWIYSAVQRNSTVDINPTVRALGVDIQGLLKGSITANGFAEILEHLYPGISRIRAGLSEHFDGRVPAFERVTGAILAEKRGAELDALAIAFFGNSILPGSFAHTRLLSRQIVESPTILIWYALFAALSSEFDARAIFYGLGAKLLRDMEQSFSLNIRPTADISFEELVVLGRIGLRSRTIKPTQLRSMLVSLLPGVEIFVRFLSDSDSRFKLDDADAERGRLDLSAERNRQIRMLLQQAQKLLDVDTETPSISISTSSAKGRRTKGTKKSWKS